MIWKRFIPTIRRSIFRQFFLSFLMLIMVPSFIASLLTYTYVVNLIEEEIERSSSILIGHFAEEVDKQLELLQNEMVSKIGYGELEKFQYSMQHANSEHSRIDFIMNVMNQLNALDYNHSLVHSSYLYVIPQDMVIHSNGGTFTHELFFDYYNHYKDFSENDLAQLFTGRKIMEFSPPVMIESKDVYTGIVKFSHPYISAVMSFPFIVRNPYAYLVVNLDLMKLQELITIHNSDAIKTAIINSQGQVITHSSRNDINGQLLWETFTESDGSHATYTDGELELQLNFTSSNKANWVYVSFVDLNELNKPAQRIRIGSIVILMFFLCIGIGLSYTLSKRMYTPIREIKEGLEAPQIKKGNLMQKQGNDFELIKKMSDLLILENQSMSDLVGNMSPIMHEHFLSKVLHGEYIDQLSVEYYMKEIGLNISQTGQLAAICIEINFYDKQFALLSETDKSFFIADVKEMIKKEWNGEIWMCQTRADLLVCITHLKQETDKENCAQTIQHLLSKQLEHFHSAIALGKTVHVVWELHESYRHALQLLKRKKLSPDVEIYRDTDGESELLVYGGFLTVDKENHLLSLYKAAQYEAMVETVHYLLDNIQYPVADTVLRMSYDILNTWFRAIASDIKHDVDHEQQSEYFQQLDRCVTVEEVKVFFTQTASELFIDSQVEEQFIEIMDYIREHITDDLSIEQFSKQLNMSVGHFSRSFKEAVGENYIEYITRCRIEMSKDLLLNTDMKINDIIEEVGYLSRSSFIKLFRKYEGLTPGKYRELHRESDK